jgi:signal peptidase II
MLFYITAITAIAFDQASKYWVRANMYKGQSIPEEGVAWLTRAHNTGGVIEWIIIASSILLAAIVFCYYYVGLGRKMPSIGLGLMMGGIAGNLTDRLLLGYVIDFINSDSMVFNIADTAFFIGILFVVLHVSWRSWVFFRA